MDDYLNEPEKLLQPRSFVDMGIKRLGEGQRQRLQEMEYVAQRNHTISAMARKAAGHKLATYTGGCECGWKIPEHLRRPDADRDDVEHAILYHVMADVFTTVFEGTWEEGEN
jgi:hypothetical protein